MTTLKNDLGCQIQQNVVLDHFFFFFFFLRLNITLAKRSYWPNVVFKQTSHNVKSFHKMSCTGIGHTLWHTLSKEKTQSCQSIHDQYLCLSDEALNLNFLWWHAKWHSFTKGLKLEKLSISSYSNTPSSEYYMLQIISRPDHNYGDTILRIFSWRHCGSWDCLPIFD